MQTHTHTYMDTHILGSTGLKTISCFTTAMEHRVDILHVQLNKGHSTAELTHSTKTAQLHNRHHTHRLPQQLCHQVTRTKFHTLKVGKLWCLSPFKGPERVGIDISLGPRGTVSAITDLHYLPNHTVSLSLWALNSTMFYCLMTA